MFTAMSRRCGCPSRRRLLASWLLIGVVIALPLAACAPAATATPTASTATVAAVHTATPASPSAAITASAIPTRAGATPARPATVGSSPSPAPGTASCAPGVELLGFSDALDKARFAGTDVGGLSAFAYDPGRDVYYALVDNERDTPARVYTVRLPPGGGRLGAPQIVAVTVLRDAAGQPFTGRTFDGEGMALTPAGDLLIASETEPAIRRFAPDGRLLAELPVPPRFLVAPRGEATANATFESLALSPDGRTLFTAVEGPLAPDGSTDDGRGRLRILRYDDRGAGDFAPVAQYFYLAEPLQGVSEIAALGERDLLVLERGFIPRLGNTVRVFRVSLDGSADVADRASLAAPGLAPLAKDLLVDVGRCPASGARNPAAQTNPLLDNFEGLALGPPLPDGRRVLLLVSDDNFGATQVTRVIALAFRP